MKAQMKNQYGAVKTVKVGFSWTMLFFGFLVPLFRGDFKWAILSIVISALTCGICWLIFPFIYNKIYIKKLIEEGWLPVDVRGAQAMSKRGIHVPDIADL